MSSDYSVELTYPLYFCEGDFFCHLASDCLMLTMVTTHYSTSVTTARNILSNTFVQIAGKVGIAIIGLLVSKLLANYFLVSERGQYEYIYSLLAVVSIVADMGLFTIAIREISRDESKMEMIIGNILSIRNVLIVTVLVVLFGGLFLSDTIAGVGYDIRFYMALFVAGLSTMIGLLNGTITSVLQVKYKMSKATIGQVLGKVIIVSLMFFAAFALFPKAMPAGEAETSFWGFQMFFIAGVLGNLVMYLYTRHHVKKYTTLKYRFDFGYWKRLVRDALPYGLALVLATIYFKVDILILGFMYDSSTFADEQIGYYAAPVKIVEIFAILPLYFLNALLPVLAKYVKEKSEKLQKLVQYSFDFLFMLAMPLVAGGVALSYQIINATNSELYLSNLAEGFVGSDILLQILIFTSLFSFLNLLFNFMLVAVNEQKKLIVINSLTLLFNIVTNILFIPVFGLVACAVTTVITEMLVLGLTYYYARQYVDFNIGLMRSFKVFIVSILMGIGVYLLRDTAGYFFGNDLGVVLLVGAGGVFYLGMLWVFGVVNKEMLGLMRRNV